MLVVLCLFVTGGLLVSGHVYHMSSVRIEGGGHSTCPSDNEFDAVKTQLSKKGTRILPAETLDGREWLTLT